MCFIALYSSSRNPSAFSFSTCFPPSLSSSSTISLDTQCHRSGYRCKQVRISLPVRRVWMQCWWSVYSQKLSLWWSVWLRWQIGWDWMQWVQNFFHLHPQFFFHLHSLSHFVSFFSLFFFPSSILNKHTETPGEICLTFLINYIHSLLQYPLEF